MPTTKIFRGEHGFFMKFLPDFLLFFHAHRFEKLLNSTLHIIHHFKGLYHAANLINA